MPCNNTTSKTVLSHQKTYHRIKKRADYLHIAAQKNHWVSNSLIVQKGNVRQSTDSINSDNITNHIGITVTKKIGNAVIRNKIKRRIRAILYDFFASSSLAKNVIFNQYDYVIIARHHINNISFAQIYRDLQWCFSSLTIEKNIKKS